MPSRRHFLQGGISLAALAALSPWLSTGALSAGAPLLQRTIPRSGEMLPVIGLVDDLVLIPLLVAWLVRMLPDALRRGYADAARTVDVVPVRTR